MEISLLADNPHESKTIAQWYFDEWLCTIEGVTVEAVNEKVSKATNRDQIPLTLLAHKNSELVGVAELKLHENKNYPEYEFWLGGMFVKASYRGQGIASALITKAKEHAVSAGVTKLFLQCESHNIALYEKHGFKLLHSGKHRLPVSIMVLAFT